MSRIIVPKVQSAVTNNNATSKPRLKQADLAIAFGRINDQKLAITLAYRIARVLVGQSPAVIRQALEMCQPVETAAAAATPSDAQVDQ